MLVPLVVLLVVSQCARGSPPNIIFILVDDLGWNDVGYHGMNHIPTPNIDALAYSGVPLQKYYVTPICTPSRAALMTGKYPIHTGMQHGVLFGVQPSGLPLSEKLLPQYLKELGYKTHLVGKWHLGSYKSDYLPFNRGFDTHLGFVTGKIDMYDHTNLQFGTWGFDFRRDADATVAHEYFGEYATDIYTDEANKIIKAHNKSEPLFLMISHSAVHSGNANEPIRAPDDIIDQFSYISNRQRQKYAGVLTKLDESVGKVMESLQSNGLISNSIVVFSTDNGGTAAGFDDNMGSNYPLRGIKHTVWEGGVRGTAVLWSPLLSKRSHVATQTMHIIDWLPTLYHAAGGNASVFENIDGINLWEALSEDTESERQSIVHNIDDIDGYAAITVGQWKLMKGTTFNGSWDTWYGPDGREGLYYVDQVYNGLAGQVIEQLGMMPKKEKIADIRQAATVTCDTTLPIIPCRPLEAPCLFNIEDDPCERRNLANSEPEVLHRLLDILSQVNSTAVPPGNKPFSPIGDPKYWNRMFVNFGDFVEMSSL